MKSIYIFGNGNTSFEDFQDHYASHLASLHQDPTCRFLVCDFRGVDTLTLEYLKNKTPRVSVFHVGDRPRYLPDNFRTFVPEWELTGGFPSDNARDKAAITACTHFLAIDFNSDQNRKSGTQKNIELCLKLGKIPLIEALMHEPSTEISAKSRLP